MNAEPDHTQDELQKILALKRHETPPPRFFTGLSEKVIDRLNTPEPGPRTFWQRLGLDIESPPVLVCASGVVVCGLLVTGLILSRQVGPFRSAPRAPDDQTDLVVAPPPTARPTAPVQDPSTSSPSAHP